MRYTITKYADMPLYDLPVAVFDFETTGVDPDNDRVVEVAVVHFNLGTSVPQVVYNKRIHPGIPIPEGASKIHGITDVHVDGCSPFGDCWPEIDEVCRVVYWQPTICRLIGPYWLESISVWATSIQVVIMSVHIVVSSLESMVSY